MNTVRTAALKRHPLGVLLAGLCIALALIVVLAGCGGAGNGDGAGSGNGSQTDGTGSSTDPAEGQATGQILWGVTGTLQLVGVDLGSSETIGNSLEQVVNVLGRLTGFAAADGQVWVARADGRITVSDAASGELTATLEIGADGIDALAVGGGNAYAAYRTDAGDGAWLVRIDADSHAKTEAKVPSDLDPTMVVDSTSVPDLVVDGDTLWALRGGSGATFALLAFDTTTLEVRETVSLDGYSDGRLAEAEDALLILTDDGELLRVDKSSRTVTLLADLSEYLFGRREIVANADSLFLASVDEFGSEVYRFDAATGEHLATYELGEEGARAVAVLDDRLYVNEDRFGDVLEVDVDSGQTLRTLRIPAAVGLTLGE